MVPSSRSRREIEAKNIWGERAGRIDRVVVGSKSVSKKRRSRARGTDFDTLARAFSIQGKHQLGSHKTGLPTEIFSSSDFGSLGETEIHAIFNRRHAYQHQCHIVGQKTFSQQPSSQRPSFFPRRATCRKLFANDHSGYLWQFNDKGRNPQPRQHLQDFCP